MKCKKVQVRIKKSEVEVEVPLFFLRRPLLVRKYSAIYHRQTDATVRQKYSETEIETTGPKDIVYCTSELFEVFGVRPQDGGREGGSRPCRDNQTHQLLGSIDGPRIQYTLARFDGPRSFN